ncbi:hypothetical protein KC19_8G110100 [Ceratodon purpureus]|uniref:Bromo domain-containing protein n=1 Tax=Ceratodon purpureus TaxID=3225 RepID=A0A8T0H135_CERPU|nr:hypothetical protein KC19_8G110100 [Ceratodon purpureus]
MCVRKSGAGDTLLRGLAHPLVAKIGKVELVEVTGGERKVSGLQEHLDSGSRCEAKEQEAKNGRVSIGNGHGMHQGEENVVVPKETNLSGVLESLMSLDPRGDFMGPLDGFSAPNHSKVIETPMCFAMMQEKIRTQQYSTWRVFVGDFERICYNALRCNQKRSIIWAAADDLLRRGKKRLEQYEGLGESLIALNKTGGSLASFDSKTGVLIKSKSENVEARVRSDDKSLVPKGLKMAITSATSDSAESKPSSSGATPLSKDVPVGKDVCLIQRLKEEKREDQMSRNATPFLAPSLDVVSEEGSTQKNALKAIVSEEVRSVESSRRFSEGGPAKISSALGHTDEDIDVEGERNVKSEDHRFDADGDATESSSSYGSAGSAMDGEADSDKMQSMFEAESNLRDGNGAVGLLEDDDGLPISERGKKALDTDWKQYRRGIEWRCHWLELRTQAIKAKIGLYDKLLRSAQSEKIWKWEGAVGEGTSARTVPVKILRNHHVIHRKHRKRAEDALDLDLGRHPVFSRYEKRKTQRKSDDGFGSTQGKADSQQVQPTDFEIAEPEASFEKDYVEQQADAGAAFVGQDSMEQLLWQLEALQVRVKKQKHLLRKEAAVRKSTAGPKAGLSNVPPRTLPPLQKGNSSAQVLPSPKAVPRVGPPSGGSLGRTSSGSGLARRRASDYDINNMVMPVNVGATFVEHVRHVDIETPLWRPVEDANPAVLRSGGSSSDEESDDELYINRHAVMEVFERQQRYMPRLKKSTGDIHTVGKGKLKLGIGKSAVQMAGKGSSASLSLPSGPAPIVTRSADNVPKRQRSNRNTGRRAPGSQLDSTVAQTTSPEVTVKPEVKWEAPVQDADENPVRVESGGTMATTADMNPALDCMEED